MVVSGSQSADLKEKLTAVVVLTMWPCGGIFTLHATGGTAAKNLNGPKDVFAPNRTQMFQLEDAN